MDAYSLVHFRKYYPTKKLQVQEIIAQGKLEYGVKVKNIKLANCFREKRYTEESSLQEMAEITLDSPLTVSALLQKSRLLFIHICRVLSIHLLTYLLIHLLTAVVLNSIWVLTLRRWQIIAAGGPFPPRIFSRKTKLMCEWEMVNSVCKRYAVDAEITV